MESTRIFFCSARVFSLQWIVYASLPPLRRHIFNYRSMIPRLKSATFGVTFDTGIFQQIIDAMLSSPFFRQRSNYGSNGNETQPKLLVTETSLPRASALRNVNFIYVKHLDFSVDQNVRQHHSSKTEAVLRMVQLHVSFC